MRPWGIPPSWTGPSDSVLARNTSFCTPDKLGKLQYADERVTIRADRSQRDGLYGRLRR
ncbi:MAG: hypothetical protein R3F31_13205 [Verrucomicrobiales bacterium]